VGDIVSRGSEHCPGDDSFYLLPSLNILFTKWFKVS
jgi:hypothetical protein